MQTMGNECVFQFKHRSAKLPNTRVGLRIPDRVSGNKINGDRLCLNQQSQILTLVHVIGRQCAPALDRGFEIKQALVKSSMGNGWCHVAHQRCR